MSCWVNVQLDIFWTIVLRMDSRWIIISPLKRNQITNEYFFRGDVVLYRDSVIMPNFYVICISEMEINLIFFLDVASGGISKE